jgi:cytochrome c
MKSKRIPIFLFLAGSAVVTVLAAIDAKTETDGSGRAAFEKRCSGCHALDRDKEGPRLAGVWGRKAGSVAGFPYSDAVKKSAIVWNEALLDKWLTDPESVIPESDMAFRLSSAEDRASIIAFLKGTGR